jgi:hypothetical protein
VQLLESYASNRFKMYAGVHVRINPKLQDSAPLPINFSLSSLKIPAGAYEPDVVVISSLFIL